MTKKASKKSPAKQEKQLGDNAVVPRREQLPAEEPEQSEDTNE